MAKRITARRAVTRHEVILVAVLLVVMSVFVWLAIPPPNPRPIYAHVANIVVIETEQGEEHALCMRRIPGDATRIGRMILLRPNRPEWEGACLQVVPIGESPLLIHQDDLEAWQDRLRRLLSASVEQGEDTDGFLARCATVPLVPHRR